MKWCFFDWLGCQWASKLRKIDAETLWPACKAQARDLDEARHVFMVHAMLDPAWRRLGGFEEVWREVQKLE